MEASSDTQMPAEGGDLDTVPGRLRYAIKALLREGGEEESMRLFARSAGLPYRSLQDYLSGQRMPGGEALQKIAKRGIDVNWVLLGSELTSGRPTLDKDDYRFSDTGIHISDRELDAEFWLAAAGECDDLIVRTANEAKVICPWMGLKQLHERLHWLLQKTYLVGLEAYPDLRKPGRSRPEIVRLVAAVIKQQIEAEKAEIIDFHQGLTDDYNRMRAAASAPRAPRRKADR